MVVNTTETVSKESIGQSNLEQEKEAIVLEKRISELLQEDFAGKKISAVADTLLEIERSLDSLGLNSQLAYKTEELFEKILREMNPDGEEQINASLKELESQEKEEMNQLQAIFKKSLGDMKEENEEKEEYGEFDIKTEKGRLIMNNTWFYEVLQGKGIKSLTEKQKSNIYMAFEGNNSSETIMDKISLISDMLSVLTTKEDMKKLLDNTELIKDMYDESSKFTSGEISLWSFSKYHGVIYNAEGFTNDISMTYEDIIILNSGEKESMSKVLKGLLKNVFCNVFGMTQEQVAPIEEKITIKDGMDIRPAYVSIMSILDKEDKSSIIDSIVGNLNYYFDGFDYRGIDLFITISKCKPNSFIVNALEKGDIEFSKLLGIFSVKNIKKLNIIGEDLGKCTDSEEVKEIIKNMDIYLYSDISISLAFDILETSIPKEIDSKESILNYLNFALYSKKITQQEQRLSDTILDNNITNLLVGKFEENKQKEISQLMKETYNNLYKEFENTDINIAKDLPNEFIKKLMDIKQLDRKDKSILSKLLGNKEVLNTLLFSKIEEKQRQEKSDKMDEIYTTIVANNPVFWNSLNIEEKYVFMSVALEHDLSEKSLDEIIRLMAKQIVVNQNIEEVKSDVLIEKGLFDFRLWSLSIMDSNESEIEEIYKKLKEKNTFTQDDVNSIAEKTQTTRQEYLQKQEEYDQKKAEIAKSYESTYDDVIVKNDIYNLKDKTIKQVGEKDARDSIGGYENQTTQTSEEGMSITSTEDENGLYITNFTIPEEYTASGDATTMEIKATSHVETSQKILENYVTEILGLDIDLRGTLDSFVKATGIQISDQHPIGLEEIGQFNIFMQAFMIKYVDRTTLEMNNINYDNFLEDLIYRPSEVLPMIGKLIKRGENVLSDTLEYKDQAYRFNFIGKEPLHNLQAKEVIKKAMKKTALS